MRILVVTSEWPTPEHPTSGVFVASQVDTLRRLGVEIEVFAFRGVGNPARYLAARRAVRKLIGTERFDAVHAHFGQSALVVPASSPPRITSFYGSDVFGVVSTNGRYTLGGIVLSILSRAVARRASANIAISSAVARRLPRSSNVHIIPLGVDLDTFRPIDKDEARRALGLESDVPLVLFNGDPRAGAKRYALAKDVVGLSGSGAALVTVSDQPRSTVNVYMNACDAFLITSRHEGGPVALREALACGLPVVAVDVGDVKRWIAGIEDCAICTDDDPATLARALDVVLARRRRLDVRSLLQESEEMTVARRIADVYRSVAVAASV